MGDKVKGPLKDFLDSYSTIV